MPLFETLWRNHPSNKNPAIEKPCDNEQFDNQCCIRLGVAFASSGIDMGSYSGDFCWNDHGRQHPLRVEQMLTWLTSDNANFVEDPEVYVRGSGPARTFQNYMGRKGIVLFRNFWGRGNQGDHIDLWNGQRIAHGDNDYFERSQELWFWKLKQGI